MKLPKDLLEKLFAGNSTAIPKNNNEKRKCIRTLSDIYPFMNGVIPQGNPMRVVGKLLEGIL